MKKSYREIEVSKAILQNNYAVKCLLDKWNDNYFLQNGIYVMAPRNLAYLHFVLDINLKFSLEDHPYPYDLLKKT